MLEELSTGVTMMVSAFTEETVGREGLLNKEQRRFLRDLFDGEGQWMFCNMVSVALGSDQDSNISACSVLKGPFTSCSNTINPYYVCQEWISSVRAIPTREEMSFVNPSMDAAINKAMDNALREGAVGVVCSDKNGLCLSAKGTATNKSAGLVSSITKKANRLTSDPQSVVVVETEYKWVTYVPLERSDRHVSTIFIRSHEDLSVGVFKLPPS
ncbi:hypothetical protein PROFUN_15774 [Planoprotostelium fungivorum]|uniref:Late endosomal/lysosomal adaptor and MAPK and MTOR activator 5 n=1 Tax=Planoprotostelium fungivorum TaxID=1890364 RepID=A0A2P6MQ31_9EUKA|nr:hypothetical protein PROFUN_15774 [Planoprotostelium fungivorum]